MDRKKWLSLVVGGLVTILFLHLLVRGIPWRSLGETFTHIKWVWCIPAVLLYLLGHLLRGVRCAWIMRPYKRMSIFDATQVVWIGYAANNILPARLGEGVRACMMARREGLSEGVVFSTLFVERMLDGLSIVGILWVTSWLMPEIAWIRSVGQIASLLFLGAFFVMLIARIWRGWFERILAWVAQRLPASVGGPMERFGHRLLDGMACLRMDRHLAGILVMSPLVWLVEGAMFWALLPAFGLQASLTAALLAMAITNLGVLLPSTPGHIGTFHFFCSKALLATGVISSSAIGVSYATVIHALQFVPVTLLGMWSMSMYGFNLRTLLSFSSPPKTQTPILQTP